ncbi:MAG: HAMP domain-containing sensor histidine kinase [Elusimicrobiota bacterium]|jgi:signal transduction histidine kinase
MKTESSSSPLLKLIQQEGLQTVAHDLRTPITVIKGNLQLLLSGIVGEMSGDQLMLIQRSIGPLDDLIRMTDNILQMAQIENKELQLSLEDIDLDKLLAEICEFYQLPFQQRGMQIHRDGNTVGLHLKADGFWIRRVLHNLVWNAYKFTPNTGTVVLQVRHKGEGVEILVQDNGRGIPAENLNKIFDKFEQTDVLKDRKLGNGLGLWISKQVIERHGGSISVESKEGQGSSFILYFPPDKVF